jgi:hypothetical protein
MAYYDAEGNEVEGLLTQEDLDAKLEEERTTLNAGFEEKNNETQQKIGELESAATAAQAAVDAAAAGGGDGAGGDKDENLAALRSKLDETNNALTEERDANKTRFTNETNERVSNAILEVAGDDEVVAEKVRHHFSTTLSAVKAETPAEIKQKVESAMKLSVDLNSGPSALDTARSGPAMGQPAAANSGKKPFTATQIAAGKGFGVTDADRDKYGGDPRLNK